MWLTVNSISVFSAFHSWGFLCYQAVWISVNISTNLLILYAVWNRPYGVRTFHRLCAFIIASCVPRCQTAAVFPIPPPPILPRLPLFPTLSKNVCHHLPVFPHRSSVPFISLTRCTALIIQRLETDLDFAEPTEELFSDSVTHALILLHLPDRASV